MVEIHETSSAAYLTTRNTCNEQKNTNTPSMWNFSARKCLAIKIIKYKGETEN